MVTGSRRVQQIAFAVLVVGACGAAAPVRRTLPAPAPPAAPACGCADAKDILYRIKEASAAMNAFKVEIVKIEAREMLKGAPVPFSTEAKEGTLVPRIQAVLNALRAAEPAPQPSVASPASTDPHSCTYHSGGSGTACLTASLRVHEALHEDRCTAAMALKPLIERLNPASDYRSSMRLADYAQEEVEAYQREIDYLLGVLKTLPASCSQKGWSGVVSYAEVYHSRIDTSHPGDHPERRASIGFEVTQNVEDTTDSWLVYSASLNLVTAGGGAAGAGLQASVVANVGDYSRHHYKIVRKIACHVTGSNVPLEKVGSVEDNVERNGEGSFSGTIGVSIGNTFVNFRKPEIKYVNAVSKTGTVDGCDAPGAPQAPPASSNVPAVSQSELVGASFTRNLQSPDLMVGSQTKTAAGRTRIFSWALVRK